jgi:glycosyltransferase involved in cell wall biosynthesis
MIDTTASTPSKLPAGVSIVVPVYNSVGSLAELAERTIACFQPTDKWELIFVVDGSPDRSWELVVELSIRYQQIRGLGLFRNFGQHNALLAGIRSAKFDVVVTMDDDLQHRPETIGTLLTALTTDVDLVYAFSPQEEHARWRNATSRLAKHLMAASLGDQMVRDSGAFRAFRTGLRDGFAGVSDPYVSIDVLLSWVTTRYVTALTPMDNRANGKSNYTPRSLVRHAVNMITGYSTKPLRVVSWLGFFFAFFGVVVLGYVSVRWALSESTVPGFAFLASLVSILAGAQLFGLGVVGEYLGRMHFRSMQRPPYVIREATSDIDADAPLSKRNEVKHR